MGAWGSLEAVRAGTMNETLLGFFETEMVWAFTVTNQNTGGVKVSVTLNGLLADQTAEQSLHGVGDDFWLASADVVGQLELLAREARGVAQRDLRRLDAVLGVDA